MRKITTAAVASALVLGAGLDAVRAEASERTIRVGSTLSAEHPIGIAVGAMGECVAERSDGRMEVQGIFNAALGGDQEMSQAARAGTLDMFMTTTSPLAGLEPKLAVFDLPFLFNDRDEALGVLDGPFGAYVSDLMTQHDLVNLGFWDYGFRQVTNSRAPITSVDDFSGLRLRVIQNNVFIDAFAALGANPIPMSWGEVFAALETGVVDGQENPILTIADAQLADVQDYVSRTNHVYSVLMFLYSKSIWETLSSEEQEIVRACVDVATEVQRAEMAGRTDAAYQTVIDAGMEVNDVDPAVIAEMRTRLEPVYAKYAEAIGPDVVGQLNEALAAVRGE